MKLKDTSFEGKGDYHADREKIDRRRCSLEEMSIDVSRVESKIVVDEVD